MNRKGMCFKDLTGAIQVRFYSLWEDGVSAVVKHAAVVMAEEEDILWHSNTIGDHDPLALQRAFFLSRQNVLSPRWAGAVAVSVY